MSKLKPIGHKFFKESYDTKYVDACVGCGRLRIKGETDYSYSSEQYCANCGKSYRGATEKTIKPIYVIGHFTQWDGKQGYQLSETKPTKIEENSKNGKGWSYFSYTEDRIGTDFYATLPTEDSTK